VGAHDPQPTTREGQVGPVEVAERPIGARRPDHAGGAKGPQFKVNVTRDFRLETHFEGLIREFAIENGYRESRSH
jgi:hypothetical protein